MHELSVALSLLEQIGEAAAREGASGVSRVHLRIGRMSGIARDALLFAWDLASADTVAANAQLHIEEVDVAVYCPSCLSERAVRAGGGLTCDTCGQIAPHVVRGRELEFVAMEILA